jgi:hypothetical protein
VLAGQTVGTVIAMITSGTGRDYLSPADFALIIVAGMCFVITFIIIVSVYFHGS